jgi:hypothetical protein
MRSAWGQAGRGGLTCLRLCGRPCHVRSPARRLQRGAGGRAGAGGGRPHRRRGGPGPAGGAGGRRLRGQRRRQGRGGRPRRRPGRGGRLSPGRRRALRAWLWRHGGLGGCQRAAGAAQCGPRGRRALEHQRPRGPQERHGRHGHVVAAARRGRRHAREAADPGEGARRRASGLVAMGGPWGPVPRCAVSCRCVHAPAGRPGPPLSHPALPPIPPQASCPPHHTPPCLLHTPFVSRRAALRHGPRWRSSSRGRRAASRGRRRHAGQRAGQLVHRWGPPRCRAAQQHSRAPHGHLLLSPPA